MNKTMSGDWTLEGQTELDLKMEFDLSHVF